MVETYLFIALPFVGLILLAAGAEWIVKRIDNLDKQHND